jgi:hypothetical protein
MVSVLLPKPSLRGAKRRSNPSIPALRYGLLRFARNDVEGPPRLNADFLKRINLIWVIQPFPQKYSA